MLLIILIGVLMGGISLLILYARWNYGVLERLGIPVDKPHFILGNTANAYDKPRGLADVEKFKRLGSVYGVYEGRQPQVHIADPELIRLITSKHMDHFRMKRQFDLRNSFYNQMPDFLEYEKWKAVKTYFTTPSLSPSKLKMMSPSMISTAEDFVNELQKTIEKSAGGKLEKYDLAGAIMVMLSDMLTQCCFSIKISNPTDPNHRFVSVVRKLLHGDHEMPKPTAEIWSYSFPFLSRFLPAIGSKKAIKDFRVMFAQILETRRKSGEKKNDIVDLCIELVDKLESPEFKKVGITEETIAFQAFLFFFAGEHQMSSMSAMLIYQAIKNPEIEKRLYKEVDEFWKKFDGKIDHENLKELPYLMACVKETLRLFPVFTRFERMCTKDWKNEEFGLDIKKGMVVVIPMWAANRHPDHFPDPETFDPERFLSPNKGNLHPYAFTSFGFGARYCPAAKFSYEILLIMCTVLLKKFKFHLRPDSTPVFIPGGIFFGPHLPFYFDVEKR